MLKFWGSGQTPRSPGRSCRAAGLEVPGSGHAFPCKNEGHAWEAAPEGMYKVREACGVDFWDGSQLGKVLSASSAKLRPGVPGD